MKKNVVRSFPVIIFLFLAFLYLPKPCQAGMDIGISVGDEGVRSFYFSVGDYYRVPEATVVQYRRVIPDDELPVVFFIAQRARVAPAIIVRLRSGGMSWYDISLRYGIGPDVYYVPVNVERLGPPYGKAYGHYRKYPRHKWKHIRLADDDIVNMVNLKFISDYEHVSPDEVIRHRGKGAHFRDIHGGIEKRHHEDRARKEGRGHDRDRDRDRDHDKNRDHDRDRGHAKDTGGHDKGHGKDKGHDKDKDHGRGNDR